MKRRATHTSPDEVNDAIKKAAEDALKEDPPSAAIAPPIVEQEPEPVDISGLEPFVSISWQACSQCGSIDSVFTAISEKMEAGKILNLTKILLTTEQFEHSSYHNKSFMQPCTRYTLELWPGHKLPVQRSIPAPAVRQIRV